jgi:dTDP-4-dehydrorhamnose reductase
MNVLIVGANGMIGSTMLRVLSEMKDWRVGGTVRSEAFKNNFPECIANNIVAGLDVEHPDDLVRVLSEVRPNVVINCAGMTKHKPEAENPLLSVPINTIVPHRLAVLCQLVEARLIHVSTDCVFSGTRGNYSEDDVADALDVYGRSKALGEVIYPNAITLRTSTIGHEYQTKHGLLEWFLSQEGHCKGYSRAIFSGLPTVAFAEVVRDIVIPMPELSGLYHVAADPIDKSELLHLIAKVYGKKIKIEVDEGVVIDRSLNASRFHAATGYKAPDWHSLIKKMHQYQ